jgi:hypothetical protein
MKEQIEQYVKNVKERFDSCRDNEAATKAALVVPLLAILGYDMADPNECKPEYKADFGERRSVKPVDWAFCVDGSLAFLVEAKAVGKSIGNYDEQLGDYFAKGQPSVKLGILTTGVEWRFFTDLDCEHIMDKEPFLKWDILNDDAVPYELLAILQRTEFKPELVKTFARKNRRQSLLVAELDRLLEPSPDFVKLAIQNFEDRNLTAAVLAEWKPILCSAIHEWAKQQMVTMALDRAGDPQAAARATLNGAGASGVPARRKVSAQTKQLLNGFPTAEGDAGAAARKAWETRRLTLKDLIDAGILKAPLKLTAQYKGKDLEAKVLESGEILFEGASYATPSAAGRAAQGKGEGQGVSGWEFWNWDDDGESVKLALAVKKLYLARKDS